MPVTVNMALSRLDTLNVPQIGLTEQSPATITQAQQLPQRVVIRNTGGVPVLVALMSAQLTNVGATSGCFQIDPLLEETFVLAPTQALYAVAVGATGRISIATSDAYPLFDDQPVSCT